MSAIVIGAFLGILWCIYKFIKYIWPDRTDNNLPNVTYTNYNEKISLSGKCPKCGHEIIKETENSVAIKCSNCGYTFWF